MGADIQALKNCLDQVESRLDEISKEMGPKLDKQKDELHKYGEATKAVTGQLDEMGEKLIEAQKERKQLKEAIKLLESVRESGKRPGGDIADKMNVIRNPGRAFSEHETLKRWLNEGMIGRHSGWAELQGAVFPTRNFSSFEKRSDFFGSVQAGDLVVPFWPGDIIIPRRRMPIHRRFVNIIEVPNTDTVSRRKEKTEYFVITKVAQDQTSGNNTVVLENVQGLSTETGWNQWVHKGTTYTLTNIDEDTKTITVSPVLAADADKGDLAESQTLSLSSEDKIAAKTVDEYENYNVPIEKLMEHSILNNDTIDDVVMLEDEVNRKLLSKLARAEEDHVFYGTGAGKTLPGFFEDTDIPEVIWSNQTVGTKKIDMLLFMATVCATAEYEAEAFLLNHQDNRDITLTKGTDGHYLFYQVMVAGQPMRVWGAELVPSNSIKVGDVLTGEFSVGATLFDRMDAQLAVGEPDDTFLKDQKAVLAKERIGFDIDLPGAFCKGKFDSKPGS